MRFGIFVLCVLAGSAVGQEKRNKLVFPPGATEPLAEATPAAPPEVAHTPEDTINLFFLALQANRVDGAYDSLVKGTLIADRPQDVNALKEKTKEALETYGSARGYEEIDEIRVGKHLLRKTCISLNADLPLRWRFYFYRSTDEWKIVDMRIDDALVELFEDASRRH